ncbi:MAG TPA: choice-of-anchor L domain-containing protein, partial [Candidatus Nitrosocosmicus sp.]|nr:choice-of-anchor L domain-containing protein [Candidatus Nitrosocosmicus sp.]
MLLLSFSGNSQITLNTTMTPAQYVQNVLLGPGNVVSNITFNGSAAAANTVQNNVASFTSPAPFPMSAGLLMTTNIASDAIGPNNSASQGGTPGPSVNNDPDLGLIAGGAVTSGAIIEFDFVAGSGFSFSYIFGSDEYPEWAPPNASVNDVFGFFLSGPGIAGGQGFVNNAINIARLPNNTQVSIDNVNPVTNTAFYVNNGGGAGWGTTIEYDGTTTLLTASPTLVCGTTYHMKLAVANTSDDAWGSAVFIQSGSFVTGSSISAGPNQAICTTASGIVQLAGVLSSITGQVWSTSGTGTFSSPNSPTATYTPSAADIAAGSVTITYTGNGLCSVVPLTSTMTLTFLNPTVTVTPASTTHC